MRTIHHGSDISQRDASPQADAPFLTFETYRENSSDPSLANVREMTVRPRHRLARLDAVIAVALLAIALAARAPFIIKGETLLHSDEAITGLMAQDIAEGRSLPIYFYGQRYMGSLEAFVIAAISPLFDNPIHALRTGPAIFLALMVAAQYLMLTRWFGRAGGLIGAAVLICGSPMFMQWSISARGAYIEILFWGTLLLWSYTEWFMPKLSLESTHLGRNLSPGDVNSHSESSHTTTSRKRERPEVDKRALAKQALFGFLIGSGLWLNPAIVLFIVPIVIHALLNRPLAHLAESPISRNAFSRFTSTFDHVALPIAALAAVLLLNITWAVWVADHKVHSALLLGIVPKPVAALIILATALAIGIWIKRKTRLFETTRRLATDNAALLIGAVIGVFPAVIYTVFAAIGVRPLDPSLPLGFRPIWFSGETLVYLLDGLPLLLGADPRPFLQLVGVGRDTVAKQLDVIDSALVVAANWMVLGCIVSCTMMLISEHRAALSRLLRLRPLCHAPVILLMGGVASATALYLLGGCTLDFTTIRYLIPLWAFIPGLMAALFVGKRFRLIGKVVPLLLCAAWATGQVAMSRQLGAPHSLRALATQLVNGNINIAVAEPLDAHLLSYLTRQKCRTIEFESFWPRLGHYHSLMNSTGPANYVVQTSEIDRTWDWIAGGWPGETPPETKRFLWPKLRRAINDDPNRLTARTGLGSGYECIRLSPPLNDRTIFKKRAGTKNTPSPPTRD